MRVATGILLSALLIAGCATKHPVAPVATTAPTTKPSLKSDLALHEIEPYPVLATTQPSSQTRANLDAVELFAHARRAMLNGQRYTAINLLEKAIALDPDSYELRFWLGQAYTTGGLANDQSIAAYEAAAKIDPDHIVVHSELGRQYLAKNDTRQAIEHLILATQTADYDSDDSAAAVVDFYLGKSLQQAGYDRAALEAYERLLDRLRAGGLTLRGNPELAYLAAQPQALFLQIGELMEKRGQLDEAILLYEQAAERKPDDFAIQSHLVRAYTAAGRRDDAVRVAADAVRQTRANADSVALLKDIFNQTGGDDALIRELDRLRRQQSDDRVLLYALVDILTAQNQTGRATQLLAGAARDARYETELVRRLFRLYDTTDHVDSAATLLIEALAARPDNARDLAPLWSQLLRPWRRTHLTLARVQALQVSPEAVASKLYWVSEMARLQNRQALMRSSLDQAVKQVPPFAPAYRSLLSLINTQDDLDASARVKAADELIASVDRAGAPALAAELRGTALLNRLDPAGAIEAFAKAESLGDDSPDLMLGYAAALDARGQIDRSDQVLLQLAGSHPTCDEAYLSLFRAYIKRQQPDNAVKILQQWLAADPSSINARILEATICLQANQPAAAERVLTALFDREPDNADVLTAVAGFYNQTGRTNDYIQILEKQRAANPGNRLAVEQLVLLYAAQQRLPDASRLLDSARADAAGDSDLLYHIASLYTRIGQKETTERVLEQIVESDSSHAPACNDLGYSWAEQGKNLSRAESLIRVAVEKEPDNHSFLDSLGWVLYKRGRFDLALQMLQNAVDAASEPDPIVLDHLGDTLYRLDRKTDAADTWKKSNDRISIIDADNQRDDLKTLRLQLQQKLKQAGAGQPVSVSPVVEQPPKQAKN